MAYHGFPCSICGSWGSCACKNDVQEPFNTLDWAPPNWNLDKVIPSTDEKEHRSTCALDEQHWYVDRLWELSKNLPTHFKRIGDIQELDETVWEKNMTVRECAEHFRQVQDADMSYPILLSAEGWLMDGAHRLAKAYLEQGVDGKILVRQFPSGGTPLPDFIEHASKKEHT